MCRCEYKPSRTLAEQTQASHGDEGVIIKAHVISFGVRFPKHDAFRGRTPHAKAYICSWAVVSSASTILTMRGAVDEERVRVPPSLPPGSQRRDAGPRGVGLSLA